MEREFDLMLQRAQESVEAAEELMEAGHFGFAASRAYYAMFYAASALLASMDLGFSKHAGVIAAFGEKFAKPRLLDPVLHKYLLEAFEARHIGDYSFTEKLSLDKAKLQAAHAREFLSAAQRYLEKGTK